MLGLLPDLRVLNIEAGVEIKQKLVDLAFLRGLRLDELRLNGIAPHDLDIAPLLALGGLKRIAIHGADWSDDNLAAIAARFPAVQADLRQLRDCPADIGGGAVSNAAACARCCVCAGASFCGVPCAMPRACKSCWRGLMRGLRPLDKKTIKAYQMRKLHKEQTMTRTVYVNGEYLPETEAKVSIFDRGFLMADGVYEVTSVLGGKLIDFAGHAKRLERSLSELDMAAPVTMDELLVIHRELVKLNGIEEGMIYLQVTRGAPGDRDFAFPDPAETPSTIVLFTQNKPGLADNPVAKKGIKVIGIEDIRWGRRDIKTVQLLYPSMGKMMAKKAGCDDAWMIEDGKVTEGTSNNAYIVKGGKIITRELSNDILHGITRAAVLRFAKEAQMEVEERSFTIEEAQGADEAFVTSASTFVMPVVEIDGAAVGTGTPGPVAARLREIYLEESLKVAV
mgnify:CR=1 FL=1